LIFDGTTIKIGNKAGECYTESTATSPSDNSIFIGTGAGRCSYTDRAKQNIYLGYYVGQRKCSQYNIAIGEFSQASCSTNSFQCNNISIGRFSLRNHEEGIRNITLGNYGGLNLYYGSCNTFIGHSAGICQNPSSSGSTKCYMDCNVFIGQYVARSGFGCNNVWIAPTNLCLSSVWFGKSNVLVGSNAGLKCLNGDDNVLLGSCVSWCCLIGSNNVSLGSTSSCCLIGCNNVAIGRCSSRTLKGCNNVSIGDCSSFSVSGSNNVTIGSLSLSVSGFDGCDNVSIGYSSGNIEKGCSNVFIGAYSGIRPSTCSNEHSDNVFIGKNTGGFPNPYAGDNAVCNNVFIGSNAGCCYCGNFNTIIGSNAGESFAGVSNVFIGSDAGCSVGGCRNVLIGSCAGFDLGGSCNVVIGNDSFKEVSSTCAVSIGNSNFIGNNPVTNGVYIGNDIQGGEISIGNSIGASGQITIGNETNKGGSSLSIAIGHCAAYNNGARECSILIGNCSNFSGSSCCSTIIGDCAGLTSSGDFNLILGNKAGCHSNHSCSVIIGYNAGNSSTHCNANNTNNIIIGHNAGVDANKGLIDIADKCNTIVIGNNNISHFYTKMRCASLGGTAVKWDPISKELAADSSSRRFKTNIRPFLGGIKETLQLNPVRYKAIEDPNGRDHIGFIAEEVNETDVKEFVIYDENQEPLAVSYDKMVALLTGAVKELYAKNTEIKERLSTLENTIQSHIENHA
jgi:hypothetical protein